MPLTVPSALQDHLDGELATVASLWEIVRRDGITYRLTDHDKTITFEGEDYVTGVGYDRTAIEDKLDMSVDNMEVRGIIDGTIFDRSDIRGGLLDGARVTIRMVNWADLNMGSLIRRSGWIGSVKQNNLSQFDAELRGLTQALSEGLTLVYTPACPVDLGSRKCGVPITTSTDRAAETLYRVGTWVSAPNNSDLIFKVTAGGTSSTDAINTDFASATIGTEVTDGSATFTAFDKVDAPGTVTTGGDRKTFSVNVTASQLGDFPDWFNNGAVLFTSGDNAGISRGIKTAVESSGGGLEVELHLRMPFNVEAGDTCTMIPGCNKTVADCGNKFDNVLNFQGHPYIPGENYLKKYPNAK